MLQINEVYIRVLLNVNLEREGKESRQKPKKMGKKSKGKININFSECLKCIIKNIYLIIETVELGDPIRVQLIVNYGTIMYQFIVKIIVLS